METITIRKFAGIEHIELELTGFNIFIGKQASGKSITAKVIFFFKETVMSYFESLQSGKAKKQITQDLVKKFQEFFPTETWNDSNFYIEYQIDSHYIKLEREKIKEKNKIHIVFSDGYEKVFLNGKNIISKDKKLKKDEDTIYYKPDPFLKGRYLEYAKKVLGDVCCYTPLFVPAGRSFFANLQNNIFAFLSSNKALDPFLVLFGQLYENFKPRSMRLPFEKEMKEIFEYADKLILEILGSNYLQEKNKDYLVHPDSRKINVSFSSSGQQETLPLLLILRTILGVRFLGDGSTLFIEEPEAHLFPAAQKRIIELMGLVSNKSRNHTQFIITTHSPYTLTSINNLIQASIIAENADTKKKNKINHIIPSQLHIESSRVSAYAFSNGKAQSILDKESGLIDGSYLDNISDEISSEFDELLELI